MTERIPPGGTQIFNFQYSIVNSGFTGLGVMFIISVGSAYLFEFFKFADTIALLGSLIIGAIVATLYYFKPFKGRVDDKI